MTSMFTLREVDAPESSRTRPRPEIDPIGYRFPLPPPPPSQTLDEDMDLHRQPNLNLSLGPSPPSPSPPPPPPPQLPAFPPPQPAHHFYFTEPQAPAAPVPRRRNRRNPTHAPREGKSATIEPPFPWATNRRAQVHSLKYLIERGITTISGDLQCKRCEEKCHIEYNLQEKFSKVGGYLAKNMYNMNDRAPEQWMNPTLGKCDNCHQENSLKPKMAEKKKFINWLFLLLGEMVGCCTLEQLKYFCKHAGYHRTGAKNRLVFLTYLGICNQIDPNGPFKLKV